jgi:L-alanine-DL-glutamate epimerase-like enolase superfamily enzyme
MTVIDRIETIPFRIPLISPVAFATGLLTAAEHVLVRVTDSDGATGVAEAIPRPMIYGETVGSTMAVYEEEIRPRFLKRSIWERERFTHELELLIANNTAKTALELALHDLAAKHLGVSCHRLLGGYAGEVGVTAVLGYGTPEQVAEEAVAQAERHGIGSFKLKVGEDLARDVATVRRVREALPDALVYVDANHGYDVLDALRFGRMVAELDLAWIEEPCPAERVLDRERVAAAGTLNVLADESVPTAAAVAAEVLGRRAHMISMKVARTGYAGGDLVRGFCELAGVPIVIGSQGDSGIGTLTSLAYGAAHRATSRYPGEYGYFLELADDLLATPLRIRDGRLAVRDVPGNGVEIDDDKLAHYRTGA